MKLQDIPIDGYETLLLDRDGTINVHILDGYVRNWNDFEFIPGVMEAMRRFHQHFKNIIVVTNQRGIGKRLYSEEDLQDIHSKMLLEINRHGGCIHDIYYSIALDDNDPMRKPNIGMFEQLLEEHPDIHPETTLMVGDGAVDMEFARNCNIDGIQIDSLKRDKEGLHWQINDVRVYRK